MQGGVDYPIKVRPNLRRDLRGFECQLCKPEHTADWFVQFVRDASGKLPNRCESICVPQRRLDLPTVAFRLDSCDKNADLPGYGIEQSLLFSNE